MLKVALEESRFSQSRGEGGCSGGGERISEFAGESGDGVMVCHAGGHPC